MAVTLRLMATCALLCGSLLSAAKAAEKQPPLERAQAALAAGQYGQAYAQYHRIAQETDSAQAQFTLGLFHRNGWGRAADPAAAVTWFTKAAAKDMPVACHLLAEGLERGAAGRPDPKAAVRWYRRAVELGHHGSLCPLAELHMTGRGVSRNPAKALDLCRSAIQSGVPQAHLQLGRFLLEGDPSIRDPQEALATFERAARSGSPEAQCALGGLLRDGRAGTPDLPAARRWFESAAAQGYIPAYYPTAELYFGAPPDDTGKLAPENLAKAYLWLRAVVERSDSTDEQSSARKFLKRVRDVMPPTWLPGLDTTLTNHLTAFPAPAPR